MTVSHSPERTKISVGSNPWRPGQRTHEGLAQLCGRYGGGGHPGRRRRQPAPRCAREGLRGYALEMIAELQR